MIIRRHQHAPLAGAVGTASIHKQAGLHAHILPPVNVDAFVPHYLKRVEAEENWLKTHEETNRDNYIKRV